MTIDTGHGSASGSEPGAGHDDPTLGPALRRTSRRRPAPELVVTLRAAGCVFAEDEAALLTAQARTPLELDGLVARRVAGEPLEQVLGWAEFCGLRVAVEPGVFVPRRRSAFLVERAALAVRAARATAAPRAAHAPEADETPRATTTAVDPRLVVVDLCCGSGAIAAALLARIAPDATVELHAADLDPVAVRCARRNLGSRGRVHVGDLFAALPHSLRGRIDILVASTPYVPSDAVQLMPPEARDHEPLEALEGGPDGLHVVRRLIAEAPEWMAPAGRVLLETSAAQASTTVEIFAAAGLSARVRRSARSDSTVVETNPRPRPAQHIPDGSGTATEAPNPG